VCWCCDSIINFDTGGSGSGGSAAVLVGKCRIDTILLFLVGRGGDVPGRSNNDVRNDDDDDDDDVVDVVDDLR